MVSESVPGIHGWGNPYSSYQTLLDYFRTELHSWDNFHLPVRQAFPVYPRFLVRPQLLMRVLALL
jgi:hypothetical protein